MLCCKAMVVKGEYKSHTNGPFGRRNLPAYYKSAVCGGWKHLHQAEMDRRRQTGAGGWEQTDRSLLFQQAEQGKDPLINQIKNFRSIRLGAAVFLIDIGEGMGHNGGTKNEKRKRL